MDLTRTQTARRLGKSIGISPGSKRLLRQWKTVKASPTHFPTQAFHLCQPGMVYLI